MLTHIRKVVKKQTPVTAVPVAIPTIRLTCPGSNDDTILAGTARTSPVPPKARRAAVIGLQGCEV